MIPWPQRAGAARVATEMATTTAATAALTAAVAAAPSGRKPRMEAEATAENTAGAAPEWPRAATGATSAVAVAASTTPAAVADSAAAAAAAWATAAAGASAQARAARNILTPPATPARMGARPVPQIGPTPTAPAPAAVGAPRRGDLCAQRQPHPGGLPNSPTAGSLTGGIGGRQVSPAARRHRGHRRGGVFPLGGLTIY